MNSEENKKIRREITYLSGLNNRYIVRYFQTWVEREIDPNIIAEFADEGSEYYDEEESSEFEMKTDAHDTINTSKLQGRSNSMGRKDKAKMQFKSSLGGDTSEPSSPP